MATINVSDRSELLSALSAAKGGDTIVLAAGHYGSVQITQDYGSQVTMRSATPLAAKFSNLSLTGVSNLRVDGVHVDNNSNGAASAMLVSIVDSHHVQLVNSEVNGLADNNYSGWWGIHTKSSQNITISNNSIHDVYRGMAAFGQDNIQVSNNKFGHLADDSMKFSGAHHVLVENNQSSGPVGSAGAHMDFIQFQGAPGCSDVTIRGNVFLAQTKSNTQGIYFESQTHVSNALIEDNIIHTGMYNGILMTSGSNVTIRDNTLLNTPGAVHTATMITAPAGSLVTNNIASSYAAKAGLQNNLILQNSNSSKPYYITDYFVNGDAGRSLTLADLAIVKGSLAETMGAAGRLKELIGGGAPAPAPAPPAAPKLIYSKLGDHEFAAGSDVINVAHASKFAVPAATIAFAFDADTVAGMHGLLTKDAYAYAGGGNHFAAYLKDGSLNVMFESGGARRTFTAAGIKANQEYDVQASFGNGKVGVWLDGKAIGSATFNTDWSANKEYMQIGAHGGWSASGAPDFQHVFDGTISDVRIVTGVQSPAQMAALLPAAAAAAAPAADAGPDLVFSRPGATEFTGTVADIIKVKHSPALEIGAGSINFTFDADTVSGRQGLLSKDAAGFAGGGNHIAAWLEGDTLNFRFEDADSQAVFAVKGIKANQGYEVLAVFDADEVGLYVDDALVGRKAFAIDLAANHQVMQIGGWDGATADDPFDGTISDVRIFDQLLTPHDLPLL